MTARRWWAVGRTAVVAMVALAGCALDSRQVATPPAAPMLRVGLSPDAPPIAFRQNDQIVGVEPDLAQAIVDFVRRPIALVPLPFDELIPALLDGRIDAVMSGLSVTPARQVRVAFSEPYMRSGLLPAARRAEAARYGSRDAILRAPANVGVRMGSTAESWAQSNMRFATVVRYPTVGDAARELTQGRLDLIVSDAPQVAWAVSEHAGMLQVLPVYLTDEQIAWAFRPQDGALRERANATLAALRADGRLRAILQRWIPFLDRLERAR